LDGAPAAHQEMTIGKMPPKMVMMGRMMNSGVVKPPTR